MAATDTHRIRVIYSEYMDTPRPCRAIPALKKVFA